MGRHYIKQELQNAQNAEAKQTKATPKTTDKTLCRHCGRAFVNRKAHERKCKLRKKE